MKRFLFLLTTFLLTGSLYAQELTMVYPNSVKRGETLSLQISGTGTHFTQASSLEVSIFTSATLVTANSVNVINDNTLLAEVSIPASTQPGVGGIGVSSSNDGFMYLQGFTITNEAGVVPEIISVSPASGNKGQTLQLTITGQSTSFTQATDLQLFFMGQASAIMVNQLTAISDTELKADIEILPVAIPGSYTMGMHSSVDGFLQYTPGFRVNAGANDPRLVSLSQNTGFLGHTLELTITGANTTFMQGSGLTMAVFFNSATSIIAMAEPQSNTELDVTLTIPNDQLYKGIYSVIVYSGERALQLDSSFTVLSVGLDDVFDKKEVSIFPSPVHDRFSIRYPGPVNDLQVINTIGQAVMIQDKDIQPEGEVYRISLLGYELPPGVYYIKFRSGTDQLYRKILID